MRKLFILSLIYWAIHTPTTSFAQFFAKQKVVVWEIFDRNNDVEASPSTKQQIRTNIIDAFVNSRNYEAFEVNINDVKNTLRSRGLSNVPGNVSKIVREKYKVNYVIFTSIRIKQRSNSYDDFVVNLSSDMFCTETQKSERMADIDLKSDLNAIPGACAQLLSELLGEKLSAQNKIPEPTNDIANHNSEEILQDTQNNEDAPRDIVEKMPTFQGGGLNLFVNWVQNRVQNCGISGKVMVNFVIEQDGSLTDIKILSTPDFMLSREVTRVLKSAPKWEPGYENGQPVPVRFMIAVNIK